MLYTWRCPECDYDWREGKQLARESQVYCGMCAGDTGGDVRLIRQPATPEEIAEVATWKEKLSAVHG